VGVGARCKSAREERGRERGEAEGGREEDKIGSRKRKWRAVESITEFNGDHLNTHRRLNDEAGKQTSRRAGNYCSLLYETHRIFSRVFIPEMTANADRNSKASTKSFASSSSVVKTAFAI